MFDSTKSGRIEKEKVRTILNTLGHTFDDHELEVLLKQEDEEGTYIYISRFYEFLRNGHLGRSRSSDSIAFFASFIAIFGTTLVLRGSMPSFDRTGPNNS